MYYAPTSTTSTNYWEDHSIRVIQEVTPQDVISAACFVFKVTKDNLLSDCRKNEFVRVRDICYHIITKRTDLKPGTIGKLFNRDRTTVLHGLQFIQAQLSLVHTRQQMNEDLRRVMELI